MFDGTLYFRIDDFIIFGEIIYRFNSTQYAMHNKAISVNNYSPFNRRRLIR